MQKDTGASMEKEDPTDQTWDNLRTKIFKNSNELLIIG